MFDATNPFHPGELKAQVRAGKTDVSEWAAGFIRPFMPDQHRDFFSQLPFLVLAGADTAGRHWVTLLDGPEGFITSSDPTALQINTTPDTQDPLATVLATGSPVGMLGIELDSRRRNRMNGHMRRTAAGFVIDVDQSFGNCPQYIHERTWRRVPAGTPVGAQHSVGLSKEQTARIGTADTLFIGTGQQQREDHASNGFDASHRGGAPGFVHVVDATHLRIPDYAGNNFFNTIGNLVENPAIGLVFVDFETGGLLHLTGRATIDWEPEDSHDEGAQRMIDVTIDAVVDRPAALALRWSADTSGLRELVVIDRVVESADITSFYLGSADGTPLEPFAAGQHLPIELDVPGRDDVVKRSYSLSGAPESDHYRLSIKREAHGIASRHLHDVVAVGDRITARTPSGDFVVPHGSGPLVLVSAGVGLTPMVAALHEVAGEGTERPVWYVHGARDSRHHALTDEVRQLTRSNANISVKIAYSQPGSADVEGLDYDTQGRVTTEQLLNLKAGPDADYMLCGPARFLSDIRTGLERAGVPSERIHFETFGPTG
ncbi:pyridoxamine 5'-phosphate oxidase family protein [uncultured Tateyamaria sp.]|uniref:FAD-binding oxidoreductase n=1 Tax=uncultured Tateyamaria sp. TaxID=455651 RepID=UPI00260C4BD7|nr:pyridoxamine 5'-phosphate oxidase family protein [uncultured Tateyamaria sp.]